MTRALTQAELVAEATARFGDDQMKWAFQCPTCDDVATPADFIAAGADPNRVGQECIGRSLGLLDKRVPVKDGRSQGIRGCNWAAYGLFPGPWTITMPDGRTISSFRLAEPAPAGADR